MKVIPYLEGSVCRVSSAKGLVTNYGEGGLQNGRGLCEAIPLQNLKGGGGKSLSHAEGGSQKVLG